MNVRKVTMAGILFLAGMSGLRSQDPLHSHFFAHPLVLNPGMAGVEGPLKVQLGYRNQWPGAADAYATYHASMEQYVPGLQGGIGVHVMNDRMGGGVFNSTSLDLVYAYHLRVSHELTITGGFQASAGQKSLRTDGLVLPDELAGYAGPSLTGYSKWYPDFSVGFGVFRGSFYGGAAVHHLLEPYTSPSEDPNTRMNRRYTLHAGMLIPVYEKRFGTEMLLLNPNLVMVQQDIYQHLNYGLEVRYQNLAGGLWFRQDLRFSYGTLIFSAGYGNDTYRFRYSYDAGLSAPDLHIPSMGAHEFSMQIILENLYKSTRRRTIKCPKF
ncbi:MAG: PorP/SprF family type IX secretion system membrane protein [Bacteroidales bacterium]